MEEYVLKEWKRGDEALLLIGTGEVQEEKREMGSRAVFVVQKHRYRLAVRAPRQIARHVDARTVELDISEAEAMAWLQGHRRGCLWPF